MIETKPVEEMTLEDLLIRAFLWGIEFADEVPGDDPGTLVEERAVFCAKELLKGRGREEVQAFAAQMEKRLQENEHRGDWKDENLGAVISRMMEAQDTLIWAYDSGDYDRAIRQAPDCANWHLIFAFSRTWPLKRAWARLFRSRSSTGRQRNVRNESLRISEWPD